MAETRGRQLDTGRIESFSDAVLAIILTLLVLDLLPDRTEPPVQYLEDWPKYLAYLTAFLTIGSVWINHHALFSRIGHADGSVFVLNLAVLLGASLVPWPTAAVSLALRDTDHAAQLAAIVLYAVVTCMICLPWAILDLHLARRPDLADDAAAPAWLRRHARLTVGAAAIALAAIPVALWSPVLSLCIYFVVVIAFVAARTRETRS